MRASFLLSLVVPLAACAAGTITAEDPAPSQADAGRAPQAPPPAPTSTGVRDAQAAPDAADASSGECASTMAVFGGSSSAAFGWTWSRGAWTTAQSIAGGAAGASVPALVADGSHFLAVAASGNALSYTRATNGSWSALVNVPGASSGDSPALVTVGTDAHLVFRANDQKFYHRTYASGLWSATNDPVGPGTSQSFGPSPPTAAASSAAFTITQSGQDGVVYVQSWASGWSAARQLSGAMDAATTSPRIVTLANGTSLVVFSHSDTLLLYASGIGNAWEPAQALYNTQTTQAMTGSPVSLAALPSGGALLVFRGNDGNGYFSIYPPNVSPQPGPFQANSPWSAPAPLPNATSLAAPPQIVTGVCGDEAALVFVTTQNEVDVLTYRAGSWTTRVTLTGATLVTTAAIASAP